MLKGWYVHTDNLEIRDLLIKIAKKNFTKIADLLEYTDKLCAICKWKSGVLTYSSGFSGWEKEWEKISLEEAINRLKMTNVICGYEVEYKKGQIKLGCQTFSIEFIENILERMTPIRVDGRDLVINNKELFWGVKTANKEEIQNVLKKLKEIK